MNLPFSVSYFGKETGVSMFIDSKSDELRSFGSRWRRTISVVEGRACRIGDTRLFGDIDDLGTLEESFADFVVTVAACGATRTALDADDVGALDGLTRRDLEFGQMTVVVEETVAALDADVETEALSVVVGIFPACEVDGTVDGSMNLLAVDSDEVETVMRGILRWTELL